MDTIIIGILMSFLLSFFSPYIEERLGIDSEKAKIAIILVLSFVLALVVYVTPEQYIQSAMTILGSATSIYWFLWKIVFKKDEIESGSKSLMK
jgi:prepilin signal peptidase PulO-like enzyme (type II secretory pathway)